MSKGDLIRLRNGLHNRWIRMLWKSQCKTFRRIGTDSTVAEVPYISGPEHMEIGDHFCCGTGIRLEAWTSYRGETYDPHIIIGNNVTLTDRCYLSCIDRIEIGDGVLLGRDVFISDNSHGGNTEAELGIPPKERKLTTKGPVRIGKNVWVGRQATILSGVTIGEGSVIGANSLVNKDIPAHCIAAGNPARVIRTIG